MAVIVSYKRCGQSFLMGVGLGPSEDGGNGSQPLKWKRDLDHKGALLLGFSFSRPEGKSEVSKEREGGLGGGEQSKERDID